MKNRITVTILPRTLGIIFILFTVLLALDSTYGNGALEVFFGVLMHLVPSIVLTVILIVAWKHEKLGGIIYLIFGLIFTGIFDTYEDFGAFLGISGPLFLIGILFIYSNQMKTISSMNKE